MSDIDLDGLEPAARPSDAPAPGQVSTLQDGGAAGPIRVPVGKAAAPAKPARPDGRRRQRPMRHGEDPLYNRDLGREIPSQPVHGPPGVQARTPSVVEMPLPVAKSRRGHATYRSVDGKTYTVRTHAKGQPVPFRELQCLFLAMREVALGGSPIPVFDAHKLVLKDADDQQIFPIVNMPEFAPDDGDAYIGAAFSLGEESD